MENNKFKALVYCGLYVNVNLLGKGIYTCEVPFIYSKDTTIKILIKNSNTCRDMIGDSFVDNEYISNLNSCELKEVSINIK